MLMSYLINSAAQSHESRAHDRVFLQCFIVIKQFIESHANLVEEIILQTTDHIGKIGDISVSLLKALHQNM